MSSPTVGSLVLYKSRPGRITLFSDKKIEVELDTGEQVKVRPKDVSLLHPGPIQRLNELKTTQGDVQTAWELLAGEQTTLAELSELAYGHYSPSTAWSAWQLVADGLYFKGTPELIAVSRPEEVSQEQSRRAHKAIEEAAWQQFLRNIRNQQIAESDQPYLAEVVELAYKRREKSRVMRELSRPESPEAAHTLLLEIGYWDEWRNPHPGRVALPLTAPQLSLPPLQSEERRDLSHLPAFAIDDEGNQDPDDALSLEGNRLWVHIADAAALVPPDSPADAEARERVANLYLPEGIVPMLPPEATQRLGLGLNELSPALSFGLEIDPFGNLTHLEIVPSLVRVTRLSYEAVDGRLTEEPFNTFHTLAQIYLNRRLKNGAIQLDLPEVKVRIEAGKVKLSPITDSPGRVFVREAMLIAGEAAGRYALQQRLPIPFTIQDSPDEEYRFAPTPAGMFAMRRLMKRGQQTTIPGLHAGLGMPIYAQATSPLRRYLDLVVHQQIRAHLGGRPILDEATIRQRIAIVEAMVGNIRYAERLSNQHWTLVYLQQNPKWRGSGILVEKKERRGLVLIPELAWETTVQLRHDLPLDSTIALALSTVHLPALEATFHLL